VARLGWVEFVKHDGEMAAQKRPFRSGPALNRAETPIWSARNAPVPLAVGLVTTLSPDAVCDTRSNQQPFGLLCFAFQFLNLPRRHAHRIGKLRPGYGLRLAVADHALTPHHPIAFFDQGGIDGATGGCVGR
jgi:hypothetical protein